MCWHCHLYAQFDISKSGRFAFLNRFCNRIFDILPGVLVPKAHHWKNDAASWNLVVLEWHPKFRYEAFYNLERITLKLKVYASTMLRGNE